VLALFPAGPTAAGAVLSTIATAVATVAGVSFSITIVSLQLVSQQFTPRALRGFLGDRLNQAIAGYFVGVFAYCLVALRAVEEGDQNAFLPGLTVTVAVVLALVALGLLLVFVDHMGHSIQVSNIAERIAEATQTSAKNPYPSFGEPLAGEDAATLVRRWEGSSVPTVVHPRRSGFVQSVEDPGSALTDSAYRLELLVAPGDFVTPDRPIARVWSRADPEASEDAVAQAVAVGAERTLDQDVGYGVRQLVDIAVRALSPSTNDPTTAMTCIGYLQAILEGLATRSDPVRVRRYPGRELVVVAHGPRFAEHVEVLVEVGRYAREHARVVQWLRQCTDRIAQLAAAAGEQAHASAAAAARAHIDRAAESGVPGEEPPVAAPGLQQAAGSLRSAP
jgi:uncharacterized membrane protein